MKEFLNKSGCETITMEIPMRPAAARAGVATIGRNNFAYVDGIGSFVSFSAFVTDRELEYDKPTIECICSKGCELCIHACPTKALKPFCLDPARCIAFNNFRAEEHYIPRDIHEKMGEHVFGCDICQKVCQRNQEKLKVEAPPDEFLTGYQKEFSRPRISRECTEQE